MHIAKLLRCCFFLIGLFVATSVAAEGGVHATAKAKQHFSAGLAHIDDPTGPKYEDAYREFVAAYAETAAPDIAVNIGTCAFYLERDAEAIQMYEIFLAKASDKDITKKKRDQMEKDVQSLRAGLVHVDVKTKPAAGMLVDQRFTSKGTVIVNRYPVENGVATLGIHPGDHKLTLEADGYTAQTWALNAAPATSHAHEFTLVSAAGAEQPASTALPKQAAPVASGAPGAASTTLPPTEERKRSSTWIYVGATATGVFALGAVGMGLVASAKKSDFNAANDGSQVERADGLRSDTKRWLLVSDVLSGAAILSAGTTLYLYLSGHSEKRPAVAEAGWQLAPTLGGVSVAGKF